MASSTQVINMNKDVESTKKNKYWKCCCYLDGKCGLYKRYKEIDEKSHLVSMKVMKSHDSNPWTEKSLIESRLNKVLKKNEELCAYHWYNLGVGWKQPKVCQHPHHEYQHGKKSPAVHPSPISLTLNLTAQYGVCVPIGSMLCFKHLKKQVDVDTNNDFMCSRSEFDTKYIPEEINVTDEALDISIHDGNGITQLVNASPIKFQLKRKLNVINDDMKQRTHKKFQRFIDCAKKKYAECVAPGQSEELLQILNESSDEEQVLPDDIVCAVQMYQNSDVWQNLLFYHYKIMRNIHANFL